MNARCLGFSSWKDCLNFGSCRTGLSWNRAMYTLPARTSNVEMEYSAAGTFFYTHFLFSFSSTAIVLIVIFDCEVSCGHSFYQIQFQGDGGGCRILQWVVFSCCQFACGVYV